MKKLTLDQMVIRHNVTEFTKELANCLDGSEPVSENWLALTRENRGVFATGFAAVRASAFGSALPTVQAAIAAVRALQALEMTDQSLGREPSPFAVVALPEEKAP